MRVASEHRTESLSWSVVCMCYTRALENIVGILG